MGASLTNLLIAITGLEIGLILFLLIRKKPETKNFVASMTILILVMAVVGGTIPFLTEHKGFMYLFPLIYLVGLNGWLFFAKDKVYGKENWQKDPTHRKILVPWYILMGSFFPGTIALVVFIPVYPNWAFP